jgi:hypothetical protein
VDDLEDEGNIKLRRPGTLPGARATDADSNPYSSSEHEPEYDKPKKRRKGKKEREPADAAKAEGVPDGNLTKGKRKRGRPRKSDILIQAEPVESRIGSEKGEQDLRIMGDDPSVQQIKDEGQQQELVLKEVEHNSSPSVDTPRLEKSQGQENETMVVKSDTVDIKRAATGNGGAIAGKTLYRVGLSKRSRIAPLLKSFRK